MATFSRWVDGIAISKEIPQENLTADCWPVQVWGLLACENCELKDSDNCGGKVYLMRIRKGRYSATGYRVITKIERRLMK
jgi:hypothetical protein